MFAISDIHGCFKPFYELVVNRIGLEKSDKLILLGDYIDRGPQSKEVIDFIIDLKKSGFDLTTLTGNHEQMLLQSYDNPELLVLWFINNGETTLASFGLQDIHEMGSEYLAFFRNLEYYMESGDLIFVHAGFNDRIEDPFEDTHDMIWECRPSYSNPLLKGKTIIHGHRPKTIGFVNKILEEKSPVIPIDTGCVYEKELGYGNLSALDVTNKTLISVVNA